MASEDLQTNIRLPADLKNRLVESATENNRSLSAEVASRLTESYRAQDDVPPAMVKQLLLAMKGMIDSRKYQTMVQSLLAGYALTMYELIPDSEPLKANMEPGKDLAASLADKNLEGFEEALGDLLGHTEVKPVVRQIGRLLRARTESEKEMIQSFEERKASPEPISPHLLVEAKTSRLTKQRKAALGKPKP